MRLGGTGNPITDDVGRCHPLRVLRYRRTLATSTGVTRAKKIGIDAMPTRKLRFACDSPLEGDGFELVWGFSCQVVVFGL
jgi:hypothetical protein